MPQDSSEADRAASPPLNSQLTGVMGSLWRLVNLQFGIWKTRAKMAVMRIVLLLMLAFVSLLFAIVGVIFLYAGVYHILTDLLLIPAVWALLIFAGAHLLLAGMFAVVIIWLLKGGKTPPPQGGVVV